MPDRIDTAEIVSIDPETLELDDTHPGAYGFYVRLSRDPGPSWEAEFDAAYESLVYRGKPPVVFRGDTLCVFYLPLYADELSEFVQFLDRAVAETNRAVQVRNDALPDDRSERDAFRERLREVADQLQRRQ